jgi:hypothetical protein
MDTELKSSTTDLRATGLNQGSSYLNHLRNPTGAIRSVGNRFALSNTVKSRLQKAGVHHVRFLINEECALAQQSRAITQTRINLLLGSYLKKHTKPHVPVGELTWVA